MTEALIGIDIGTTNVKAVLARPDGKVLAADTYSYPTDYPQTGWAEQNPEHWWLGTVATVRGVLRQAGNVRVAGIGVSGQGCAVTLIDQTGTVIRPAIIWLDSRSEPQCERLRCACGDDILRLNGKQPAPYNADPVLMWLLEHEPDGIAAARCSLTTTGYITFRLSGETVLNTSDASILFAFDLARQCWSDELIACFGLPRHLYPPTAPCASVIGTLTREAAEQLLLPAGIPVVAGGEDTSSSGLAMGVTSPGQAFLSLGTAGTVNVVQDKPHVHPALLLFAHVISGKTLLGGSMVAAGGALNALRQWFGGTASFDDLTALAAQCEPTDTKLLFLPYLSGELQPINDGNARGVFFGLSLNTTQSQLVRAVLEGTAFAITHNIRLVEQVGTPITEIRAVGGPTRSSLWCQIIADVSGYPLAVMQENAGAPLGNALLAGAGVQLVADVAETATRNAVIARTFYPREQYRNWYDQLFTIYEQLYPQLAGQYAALAQVQ